MSTYSLQEVQFVEIGIGDGLENNTLGLLLSDWRGIWVEGFRPPVDFITTKFCNALADARLRLLERYVDHANADPSRPRLHRLRRPTC